MELQLDDDQTLFLETTRRFLRTEAPITEVRRLYDDAVGFDRGYWRRGAELGWTAMLVPENLGGGSVSGSGLADLVLVAEEIGRAVAPGPLLPVNVVAAVLARSGSADQQRDVLPTLISGEATATWAFTENDASWSADGVLLNATPTESGWTLTGTKAFVQDAAECDWLLVTARHGGGLMQFLLPRETPGLSVNPLVSLDMTRRFAHVELNSVVVGHDAVVGSSDTAASDVEHQLQIALTLQNAETVGATAQVFEMTLQYCNDRVSFGRPIGSYQALKHRLADMKMWLEACFGTASASARAVQRGAPEAAELSSVAKAYIADRCPAIVQDCVQLHGGIGVTWESDLHLYIRRVAQNAAVYGSVRQHRKRLASLLGVS